MQHAPEQLRNILNSIAQGPQFADLATPHIDAAEAWRESLDYQKAAMDFSKIMQDAMTEYAGTGEEIRLTVANADMALEKGDVDSAINILRTVGPEQPYFVEAKEKMAKIYLEFRKDKRMYAQCYRQIVDKAPTAQSYALLGDAYMAIQVRVTDI